MPFFSGSKNYTWLQEVLGCPLSFQWKSAGDAVVWGCRPAIGALAVLGWREPLAGLQNPWGAAWVGKTAENKGQSQSLSSCAPHSSGSGVGGQAQRHPPEVTSWKLSGIWEKEVVQNSFVMAIQSKRLLITSSVALQDFLLVTFPYCSH